MSSLSKYKDKILQLTEEGNSASEIRKILGCSISIVYYHTNEEEGIKQRIRNRRNLKKGNTFINREKIQKANKNFIIEYLKSHPCIDCGYSDIRALEFDHVRGIKLKNVSRAVTETWPMSKLLDEISKCEIRCCNCHRIASKERKQLGFKNKNHKLIQ